MVRERAGARRVWNGLRGDGAGSRSGAYCHVVLPGEPPDGLGRIRARDRRNGCIGRPFGHHDDL